MTQPSLPWETARTLSHKSVAQALGLQPSPTDKKRYVCPQAECDCLTPLKQKGESGIRWHCHRCDESWSHVDLAMVVLKTDKTAALRQLLTRTGHAPAVWPDAQRSTTPAAPSRTTPRTAAGAKPREGATDSARDATLAAPGRDSPTAGTVRLPNVTGMSKAQAALAYYDHGLCVIPTASGTRKPHVQWGQYQQQRPSRADVEQWWKRWPDAEIQLATGHVSGIVVVDLDGEEGRSNGAVLAGGAIPEDTPATRSGGGGLHLIYRHPGDWDVPTVPTHPKRTPPHLRGVEVKGEGGLIMAPPSVHHKSGRTYAQLRPDLELAPMPEWLSRHVSARIAERAVAPVAGSLAQHIDDGRLREALDPDRRTLHLADAGLGRAADHLIGGGLLPGNVLLLAAQSAAGGKTALLQQATDGFGAASAKALDGAAGSDMRPTVTPVLYVTEMPEQDLIWRSLARLARVDATLLRAPRSYRGSLPAGPDGKTEGQVAADRAWRASDELRSLGRFVRYLARGDSPGTGKTAITRLKREINDIRTYWSNLAVDVETVVLVLDPLHRLCESDEVSAQGEFVREVMDLSQTEGVVTLVASDTTKSAARDREGAERPLPDHIAAEMAVRGSYQLIHSVDFALSLRVYSPEIESAQTMIGAEWLERFRTGRPLDDRPAGGVKTLYADLVQAKARWGRPDARAAYWYDGAHLRFVPIPEPSERHTVHPAVRMGSLARLNDVQTELAVEKKSL